MASAMWNGTVIAESDTYESVEGNLYFPIESVNADYLRESSTHTVCGWKGTASYYDLVVDGQTNTDAAWYYAEPLPEATNIKGHIAFSHGAQVEA